MDVRVQCSFPLTPFPVCHVGESDRHVRGDFPHIIGTANLHPARINSVEYGRLSAVSWNEDGKTMLFRNHGRRVKVSYDTSCVPLLPPNTATIYDHTPNYDKEQVKYIVDRSFRHFKSNFIRTHVTVNTMIEHLLDEIKTNKETESFEPCQGSVMEFVSPWNDDRDILGYLLFAGGPNLNELNFTVLTRPLDSDSSDDKCASFDSYTDYIRSLGYFTLSYADAHNCPVMIGVRCTNHMIIFEGPSPGTETSLLEALEEATDLYMAHPPIQLLEVLVVYRTCVSTSSIALSPYIFGEAVLVTESGGVYLWEEDNGVTPIQYPIGATSVSHYWQCVFGPHPRALILAEQASVSILEFTTDNNPLYRTIIDQNSFYMAESKVTSIANHPLNPFYLFVAVGELVLLIDTRQPIEPLLEIRHELFKDIRFINVTCCPWQQESTCLMISSLKDAGCHIYVIRGGYIFTNRQTSPPLCIGEFPPPAHIDCSLHSVDTFTDLLKQLNLTSVPVNWRLSQSLVGACLVPMVTAKQFCGLTISKVGDIFMQVWHYTDQPSLHSPVPHPPKECGLWIEELLAQSKALEQMYETNGVCGPSTVTWDFKTIFNFISENKADKRICVRCWALVCEGGPLEYVPLPDLPTIQQCTLDGTSNVWECSLCHDNVLTSKEFSKFCAANEGDIGDKTDILKQLLRLGEGDGNSDEGEPLFDYDELTRLWRIWGDPVTEDLTESLPNAGEELFSSQSQQPQDLSFVFSQSNFPQNSTKKAKSKRNVGF